MRPNYEQTIRTSGNLQSRDVAMTVDESAMAHLMSVLTNLYSDPELAVIREYATNALDSHIAAGNDDPIKVTLPSDLNPTYIVEDQGVGMSPSDIENIFAKYGASTKRDNDDESGMLGLGCKSGLTYTESFTVEAVRDGVATTFAMSRGDDGTGVVRIIDSHPSPKPNGVRVSIPVSNTFAFAKRAKQFFRWWKPGTVLVNGEEPEYPDGVWMGDDILITTEVDTDYVVMGNIGYPARRDMSAHLPMTYRVVAFVPMGAVNFTPAREALHYTPLTNQTLGEYRTEVKERLVETAQKDVASAQTRVEAMDRAAHWHGLRVRDLTWKGVEVPEILKGNHDQWTRKNRSNYGWGRKKVDSRGGLSLKEAKNTLFVTGFDIKNVTKTHRRKVDKYLEDNDLDFDLVSFADVKPGLPWTETLPEVDYESVIKPIKVARNRSSSSSDGLVPVYRDGSWTQEEPYDVDDDRVVLVSPAHRKQRRRGDATLSIDDVAALAPSATVVVLGKNRWDKFEREADVAEAETIDDLGERVMDEFVKGLSDAEYLYLSGKRDGVECLSGLDPTKIDDPDLSAAVREAKDAASSSTTNVNKWNRIRRVNEVIADGYRYVRLPDRDVKDNLVSMLDEYPLVGYSHGDSDHVHEYVNAVYAARKARA